MKFYSHKDILLVDHLFSVGEYALAYGNEEFKKVNRTIAYCHDFGKYTTYFQDRLFEREKTEKKEGNHAHISAVFAAYVFLNKNLGEGYLPLLAYSAILSHHGRVKNIDDYIPSRRNPRNRIESYDKMYNIVRILNKQKENIKKNMEYVCEDYKRFELEDLAKIFLTENQSIEETLFRLKGIKNSMSDRSDLYWIHHELYSTLISSDKISAAKLKPLQQKYIDFEELEKIKNKNFSGKPKNEINLIRDEIYEQVQKQIEKHLNRRIFTITAPTGSGKTITGLFAALKLRELKPELKKIIYVLPYTSIIDQN
ncbi:MAG: CRISPR-associated endonuclease Cas3'', partial [Clostridiaceae bacterium]|nr:CRISPR-associated endonuclease Cas3'' [Clostridiaceae bacterium]